MPKISQEQIKNVNSKCSNDWRLDVQYYIAYGEKTLIKNIDIDEEHYLQFKLEYNYKNQVVLHISKYYHKKGEPFASTNGMGKRKLIDETRYNKKNVSKLIEYTEALYNKQLIEINENTEVSKADGMILQSEDF